MSQQQNQTPQTTQKPQQTQSAQTKQQFLGKVVTKLRDAKAGDPNFMEGTDQVVVTLDDGEHTVRRNELAEVPK